MTSVYGHRVFLLKNISIFMTIILFDCDSIVGNSSACRDYSSSRYYSFDGEV